LRVSPDRVMVTPGAKPIMFFTILALCHPGDEVLYPDPGFPMYASIAAFAGARPVPVPLREANAFRMDPAELASLVTDRTRLVIPHSPHNPPRSGPHPAVQPQLAPQPLRQRPHPGRRGADRRGGHRARPGRAERRGLLGHPLR